MLKGKVVVITGGAGLIGQEFVKTVAKNQGVAIIADIDREKAEVIKKELKNILKCNGIDSVELDITSKKSIDEVILYVDEKYGRIDALVNNAFKLSEDEKLKIKKNNVKKTNDSIEE